MSSGRIRGVFRLVPGDRERCNAVSPACTLQEALDGIRGPSSGRRGQLSSPISKEEGGGGKLKEARARDLQASQVVDQLPSFYCEEGGLGDAPRTGTS